MLQTIQIKNFQSHDNSVLDLSPGINTLVGDSDCGKSAVMRAILWAITNSPQGDAHVSDWVKTPKGKVKAGECCMVAIDSNPGQGKFSVCRKRSEGFNGYVVYDGGDGPVEFAALRNDVPGEVSRCFNIGPVNIQRQMDAPFLIASTPGEAARFINQLVNLTDIDLAQTEINSLARSCAADLRAAVANRDAGKDAVEKMAWVGRLRGLVDELTRMDRELTDQAARVDKLRASLDEYDRVLSVISSMEGIDCAADALDRARRVGADIGAISGKYNRLATSLRQYLEQPVIGDLGPAEMHVNAASDSRQKLLSVADSRMRLASLLADWEQAAAMEAIDLDEAEVAVNRATRAERRLNETQGRVKAMGDSLESWGRLSTELDRLSQDITQLAADLDGKICPVCGRPINVCDSQD